MKLGGSLSRPAEFYRVTTEVTEPHFSQLHILKLTLIPKYKYNLHQSV